MNFLGKIIACVNEKGGVSKTTTVKNVSTGLAKKGKKVLAIDLDASANLTAALGFDESEIDKNIVGIFNKTMNFEEVEEGFGILSHKENIDIITSCDELHTIESNLSNSMERETVLRRYLANIKDKYDYIFIDCPAGLGLYVINALFCADSIIIPTQPHALSINAFQNVIKILRQVQILNKTYGTAFLKPTIMGVLFTQVKKNTVNDNKIMDIVRKEYNIPTFKTIIPNTTKITESDACGKSIYAYTPGSTISLIFQDLVEEILDLEKKGDDK